MSKLSHQRMVGVYFAAVAILLAPVARVSATIQAGRTFHLLENCRIVTPADRAATLADLKVGDRVHIRYRDANSTLVADRIVVRALDPAQPGESRKHSGKAPPAPKPGNENLRGTIIDINLQAGTITIASQSGHKAE